MKEERLIIKHFGPIKDIDIPIRKINVLIGNQGAGKSTVAKVLAIVKDISLIVYGDIQNSFRCYYLTNFDHSEKTQIKFTSEHYSVYYSKEKLDVKCSKELQNLIDLFKKQTHNNSSESLSIQEFIINDLALKISLLIGGVWYVPAERLKQTSPAINEVSFSNDKNYFKIFSQQYSNARSRSSNFDIPFLKVKYSFTDNQEVITNNDGLSFNVLQAASGLQSVLPIIMLTQMLVPEGGYGPAYFIIEEPELSLFPNTQRDLISYLVSKTYPLNDFMFFTTHSPYVLTALNNLLYAYKIGQNNEAKVSDVIKKDFWINPNDVSAYLLKESGKVEDLMDPELSQIKVELIDEVSREINDEFDQLLKIEFSNK